MKIMEYLWRMRALLWRIKCKKVLKIQRFRKDMGADL